MTAKKELDAGGAKHRRHFDETYKRNAVELTLRGDRPIRLVAEELGVSVSELYRWRRKYAPPPGGGGGGAQPRTLEQAEEENQQLRAEVIRLREREDVLKKSLGILSEAPASGMPRLKR